MRCECDLNKQCETHAAEWRQVAQAEREAVITFLQVDADTATAILRGAHMEARRG